MASHRDSATTNRSPKTGKKQISTYVKAADLLLKSTAMDFSTAKVTSDIACFKKPSTETSVQFADVLKSMFVSYEKGYP